MSIWEETPWKWEWGRSQGAVACPLQEKAANNELVIEEIKEKLTSAISMEVVGMMKQGGNYRNSPEWSGYKS